MAMNPSEMAARIARGLLSFPVTHFDADDRFVKGVAKALQAGRPTDGETQEEAGFRQAMKVIELFDESHDN